MAAMRQQRTISVNIVSVEQLLWWDPMLTRFHNSYAQKVGHQFGLLGEEHDFPRNRHSN
jgi:hypothetical protein